jgi:hypothetical protein
VAEDRLATATASIRASPSAPIRPSGTGRFTLADGSQVRLRPVKPEDEALYEAFFARVAPRICA